MAGLIDRMIGAARLDAATYEEVEADTNATGQAMAVVLLSSVAAGIGALGHTQGAGVIGAAIAALAGWVIWAGLTYLIGTRLLPEPQTRADFGELLRTIGFSSSPGVLRALAFVPILGWIVAIIASIWMLAAMIVAIRQALDYSSTWRAVAVALIGWIVYGAFTAFFLLLFGVRPFQ